MPRLQRGVMSATGQHIYAYCHIRTNQVLYSLTRNLDGKHALKQLPDAGANNNPPTLRKDIWKPLWILSLPDTPVGHAQCLHAYKKLREWRILHETSWTPPTFFSRKHTPEEIEELEKQLQKRGGSKKETVYDLIKHEQRKLRARMVMDQKANSIADLAAVLQEQAELGARSSATRAEEQQWQRNAEIEEMVRLAKEAQNGGLADLQKEIKDARVLRQRANAGENMVSSLAQLNRDLKALNRRYQRMIFASAAVAKVSPEDRAALRRATPLVQDFIEDKRIQLHPITGQTESHFRSKKSKAREEVTKLKASIEALSDPAKPKTAGGPASDPTELQRLEKQIRDEQLQEILAEEVDDALKLLHMPKGVLKFEQHVKDLIEAERESLEATDAAERKPAPETLVLSKVLRQVKVHGLHKAPENIPEHMSPLYEILVRTAEEDERTIKANSESQAPSDADSQNPVVSQPQQQADDAYLTFAAELPSFPSELSLDTLPQAGVPQEIVERRAAKKEKRLTHPIFTDFGARVRWQNILDAEYAEMWPAHVEHERMGVSRHKAPSPNADAPDGLPQLAEIRERKEAKRRETIEAQEAKEARAKAIRDQAPWWSKQMPRQGALAGEILETLARSRSKTPRRLRDALTRARNADENERLRLEADSRKTLYEEKRKRNRVERQETTTREVLLDEAISGESDKLREAHA